MKTATIVVFLLCLIFPIASAMNPETGDYRPQYNFSYDVFDDLPPFPEDLFQIKQLFATQEIVAEHIPPDYYQPEILPNGRQILNITYKEDSLTFGNYGISIYPSRFDVYRVKKGDVINISALLYTNFGISKYQGAKIDLIYNNSSVFARLVEPEEKNVLLYPTSPKFSPLWMRVIKIQITVNETKNNSIKIIEREPDDAFNSYYKDMYGSNYTTGASVLSRRIPACRINLYQVPQKNVVTEEGFDLLVSLSYLPPIIILIGIMVILYKGIKHVKDKRQA
jgi:hypothetical protein